MSTIINLVVLQLFQGIRISNAAHINIDEYYGYGADYPTYNPTKQPTNFITIESLVESNRAILLQTYTPKQTTQSSDFIGDFNGDGIDDFVLSAPFEDSFLPKYSKSYLIYGNIDNVINFDNLTYQKGLIITSDSLEYVFEEDDQGYYSGEGTTYKTGHLCSKSGDFNNDGFDDLLVSIPYYDNNKGRIYVVYGGVYNVSSLHLGNITFQEGLTIYGSQKMYSEELSQTIGDINGDGFSDIAVSELQDPKVTVVYGDKYINENIYLDKINETQGFKILTTNSSFTGFGYWRTFDNIGDINGDGYTDMAIAESNYDGDPSAVFVIFGRKKHSNIELSNFNSSLGYRITGTDSEAMVRGLGDINGDNVSDLLIGSHNSHPSEDRNYAGKLFVILGNKTHFDDFDIGDVDSRGFTIYGRDSFDQIGEVICSGLDVNADGLNDILVGSFNNQDGAYIIFGSVNTSDVDLRVDYDRFISIKESHGAKARSVNSAGDFNSDGFDDFIVSYVSYPINEGDIRTDKRYLVFGMYNSSGVPLVHSVIPSLTPSVVPSPEPSLTPSNIPSSLPTLNPTVMPSVKPSLAPTSHPSALPTLKPSVNPTYVPSKIPTFSPSLSPSFKPTILPSAKPTSNPSLKPSYPPTLKPTSFTPTLNPTMIPSSQPNIVVRSYTDIDLLALNSKQGFKILGAANGDWSGTSVSSAGDINGDGFSDILIGATAADPNLKTNAGSSYVIFGKANGFSDIDLASLSLTQGFKVFGSSSNDYSGFSVATGGDVNRDGYSDIIIGAYAADPKSRNDAGTSYVIFGKASGFSDIDLANLTSTQGFKVLGAASFDSSGISVASAGDFNGDGYSDILIGAYFATPKSRTAAGTSYIIFGKANGFSDIDLATLSSTQGFKVLGAAPFDSSGISVASAGDINGDGYSDIIIGAYGADPISRIYAGTSYVIFGKANGFSDIDLATLSSTQGFKVLGAAANDKSGWSVASAGDVNGDGYSDILIGAHGADPNLRTDAGITYVIFGKANGFSDIDLASLSLSRGFRVLGASEGDWSGRFVSSAGDINLDGYSDIIISSIYDDPYGRSDAGTSYIIFGKASGFSDIDLVSLASSVGLKITGAAANGLSGYSLTSAGDINDDGYSDIIISSPRSDPDSRIEAGTSYVIYGGSIQDTFAPSKIPSSSPSFIMNPTLMPSCKPSCIPKLNPASFSPTAILTPKPTLFPSNEPTVSPTHLPTSAPSAVPTFIPTQAIEINTGGVYNGTDSSENFIIDSPEDITISGGGGKDMYTLKPNANTITTITDFNKTEDKINLQGFSIHSFNDVNITAGSIIINLENDQKMKLLELTPGDIDSSNFIFDIIAPSQTPSPIPEDNHQNSNADNSLIIGIAVGVSIVGMLACAAGCLWYNNYLGIASHKVGIVDSLNV